MCKDVTATVADYEPETPKEIIPTPVESSEAEINAAAGRISKSQNL